MDHPQTTLSPRARRRVENQQQAIRIREGVSARLSGLQAEHRGRSQARMANSAAWRAARPEPGETVDQTVERCAQVWLEAFHA